MIGLGSMGDRKASHRIGSQGFLLFRSSDFQHHFDSADAPLKSCSIAECRSQKSEFSLAPSPATLAESLASLLHQKVCDFMLSCVMQFGNMANIYITFERELLAVIMWGLHGYHCNYLCSCFSQVVSAVSLHVNKALTGNCSSLHFFMKNILKYVYIYIYTTSYCRSFAT